MVAFSLICSFLVLGNFVSEEWAGKDVSVRGFIYSTGSGLILTDEPDLPSCCQGSAKKSDRQIHLTGVIEGDTTLSMAEVEGKLEVDAQKKVYSMRDPKIKPIGRSNWLLPLVLISAVLIYGIRRFWPTRI